MFDLVTRNRDRKRAARKGAFIALSAVLQVVALVAVVFLADRFRTVVTGAEPLIPVKFLRLAPTVPAAPPTPRSPPPPPPKRHAVPLQARTPPMRRPSPAVAMIQPREIPNEPPPAPSTEPPEPSLNAEQGDAGVVGGVEGGTEGGVIGGVVGGQGQQAEREVPDTPTYATAGYRKPELAVQGCLQSSLTLSRELERSVSGPVTVKFAIRKDGTPTSFQVVGQLTDQRIAEVIRRAVETCRWIPGADPQGRAASIWVVVPFRFQIG